MTENNKLFRFLISDLLDEHFSCGLGSIEFYGDSGPISRVPFDGFTKDNKKIFGWMVLGENEFDPIDKIIINIGAKYGEFHYFPESDPQFVPV